MRQHVNIFAVEKAAGAAFDSGLLLVEGFSEVEVLYLSSGAAAPLNTKVETYTDGGVLLKTDTIAVGIAGDGRIVYGKSNIAPSAANAIACGPVPKMIRIYGTGGAASGVKILAFGIREETQIRG